VRLGGWSGLGSAFGDRITLGVIAGLVVGKAIGIYATTYCTARFTRATLDEGLTWADVAGVSLLSGIGFTVSLLIGELAFEPGSVRNAHVKIGVLTASLCAAALAAVVLRLRNRAYHALETANADAAPAGESA
jgi:NhaA family Na+:H+ antiporter